VTRRFNANNKELIPLNYLLKRIQNDTYCIKGPEVLKRHISK
jgi:hypothetical protein